MYLVFASLCAAIAVWFYPDLYATLNCAAVNATASARANYEKIKTKVTRMKDRYDEAAEIVRQSRGNTLFDFCLYKSRLYITELFENGLVIDRGPNLEIVYYLRDTRYRILTPKKPGPRPILRLVNAANSEDVTEFVRERLGPYGNFHNIPTTPEMLGYTEGLQVVYRRNHQIVEYRPDDVIKLTV